MATSSPVLSPIVVSSVVMDLAGDRFTSMVGAFVVMEAIFVFEFNEAFFPSTSDALASGFDELLYLRPGSALCDRSSGGYG